MSILPVLFVCFATILFARIVIVNWALMRFIASHAALWPSDNLAQLSCDGQLVVAFAVFGIDFYALPRDNNNKLLPCMYIEGKTSFYNATYVCLHTHTHIYTADTLIQSPV